MALSRLKITRITRIRYPCRPLVLSWTIIICSSFSPESVSFWYKMLYCILRHIKNNLPPSCLFFFTCFASSWGNKKTYCLSVCLPVCSAESILVGCASHLPRAEEIDLVIFHLNVYGAGESREIKNWNTGGIGCPSRTKVWKIEIQQVGVPRPILHWLALNLKYGAGGHIHLEVRH